MSTVNNIRERRRNNWQSNSQLIYPGELDFTFEHEVYCPQTNTIKQQTRTIHLKVNDFQPNITYSPHSLLREAPWIRVNPNRSIGERYNISLYNKRKKLSRLLGDVPIEYNKKTLIRTPDQLDKVQSYNTKVKRLTTDQKNLLDITEDDYILKKSDYIEVKTFLNTNPKQDQFHKQYKRVYFSYEARYYPVGHPLIGQEQLTAQTLPIRDFIFVGDPSNNTIIFGNTSRGPRRRQSLVPPLQSILKLPTQRKKRDDYWEFRLRHNGKSNPNNQELGFSIRYYLYYHLLKDTTPNFQDWFYNTRVLLKDSNDWKLQYEYHINRKFRHDLIDESTILIFTHNRAASKIIKTYRIWKIGHLQEKIRKLQELLNQHRSRLTHL